MRPCHLVMRAPLWRAAETPSCLERGLVPRASTVGGPESRGGSSCILPSILSLLSILSITPWPSTFSRPLQSHTTLYIRQTKGAMHTQTRPLLSDGGEGLPVIFFRNLRVTHQISETSQSLSPLPGGMGYFENYPKNIRRLRRPEMSLRVPFPRAFPFILDCSHYSFCITPFLCPAVPIAVVFGVGWDHR